LQQFQTSDRVRLSYTDQGDGPPVVLIAGFTAPAATWYFTEQALLDVGYRVIAFDRRKPWSIRCATVRTAAISPRQGSP
jgi:pimeloyl-ACP methyl ester carboxylesterase